MDNKNMPESNKTNPKILPARKVVLIKPTSVSTSSRSGIEYTTEKKQETGVIVAIGEGKLPVKFKIGDIVAYRRFGEDKLIVEGVEYLFITFADILGTIK